MTRCPACDGRVEVADEDAIFVRCPSCGEKIELRASKEEKEQRFKKQAKEARAKKEPINYFVELLPILISVPLSLFALLLTCIFPKFVPAALVAGFFISALGFGKSCILAGNEGNYVGFDYLEFLGGVRWPIMIVFFPLYFSGFCFLWEIAVIGCTIQKPKVYLPWIGLQVFGWVVFFLGIVCAMIGTTVWEAL
ncbi:MAG: hypothetical protein HYR84_02430 [Planctomycetes bacterium]|nr:hypothetical protein [Planctomycetota bacterium]